MDQTDIQKGIETGNTALGIEFGSTRIKAVLIGEDFTPIASGSFEWENRSLESQHHCLMRMP